MYQVLIVDDEENVVASLKKNIPWASMDLQVSGEAFSMEEALALARRQSFHIVVSDIKMPGGSGLELFSELTALQPDMQGILVSGHADFAYAQKALQCGIIGYCLKPVDPADLCAYLKKAIQRLRRDAAPGRDALLASALAEEQRDALARAMAPFGLDAEGFFIAVSDGPSHGDPILPGTASIRLRSGRHCFFLSQPLDGARAEELVRKNGLLGLGYLCAPTQTNTFSDDLRTAVSYALHRFITGKCQAVCRCGSADKALLAGVQDAIARQNDADLLALLRATRASVPDISVGCAFRISNMVHNYRFDPGFDEDSENGYAYDLDHLLSMYQRVDEMLADLIRLIQEPARPAEAAFESENMTFLRIVKYIHQHYADDLSLNALADALHVTPAYASRLFSRESGTTYRRYLTELRIDKAKELLNTTNLSLAEVCNRVGFNDYFHFLKTFKRLTGISPGKYAGGAAPEGEEP